MSQKIEISQTQWMPEWVEDLEMIAYTNSVVEVIPFSHIVVGEKQLVFDVSHHALKELFDYFIDKFN